MPATSNEQGGTAMPGQDTMNRTVSTMAGMVSSDSIKSFQSQFGLPESEILVFDHFVKLLSRDSIGLAVRGRLYGSKNHLCFAGTLFGVRAAEIVLPLSHIAEINNNLEGDHIHIVILTDKDEKYVFESSVSSGVQKLRDTVQLWLWYKDGKSSSKANRLALEKMETCEDVREAMKKTVTTQLIDKYITKGDFSEGVTSLTEDDMTEILDEIVPCSVEKVFMLFWAEDAVGLNEFHRVNGDTEYERSEWKESPDFGHICEERFRAPVNAPIGPSTTIVETQIQYIMKSRDRLQVNGCIHILDAPFGDTFRLEQSWNFRNEGQDKCRVNMRCGLMFTGTCWFKRKIKQVSIAEARESMKKWYQVALRLATSDGKLDQRRKVLPAVEDRREPLVVRPFPNRETLLVAIILLQSFVVLFLIMMVCSRHTADKQLIERLLEQRQDAF